MAEHPRVSSKRGLGHASLGSFVGVVEPGIGNGELRVDSVGKSPVPFFEQLHGFVLNLV